MHRAVPRPARLAHGHYGQRLAPVHDAARSGAAQACRAGNLIVADGMSVVWALRASGQPRARAGCWRGPHGTTAGSGGGAWAQRLLSRRQTRRGRGRWWNGAARSYPGLKIAGFRDGYFGPTSIAIVEEIRASGAHMLFVGMPTPFKETWCSTTVSASMCP